MPFPAPDLRLLGADTVPFSTKSPPLQLDASASSCGTEWGIQGRSINHFHAHVRVEQNIEGFTNISSSTFMTNL